MSSRPTRDIRKALLDKGFEEENTHHEMYWLRVDGKRTSIRTRISNGKKEYGDNLLAQMARQVKLTRDEFDDLVDCPLSKEAYAKKLMEAGHVTLPDHASDSGKKTKR